LFRKFLVQWDANNRCPGLELVGLL